MPGTTSNLFLISLIITQSRMLKGKWPGPRIGELSFQAWSCNYPGWTLGKSDFLWATASPCVKWDITHPLHACSHRYPRKTEGGTEKCSETTKGTNQCTPLARTGLENLGEKNHCFTTRKRIQVNDLSFQLVISFTHFFDVSRVSLIISISQTSTATWNTHWKYQSALYLASYNDLRHLNLPKKTILCFSINSIYYKKDQANSLRVTVGNLHPLPAFVDPVS